MLVSQKNQLENIIDDSPREKTKYLKEEEDMKKRDGFVLENGSKL